MTTPIQYPLINGMRHSFASIKLQIQNTKFTGFKSINYNYAKTREEARGNHPDALGKTRGENAYKCDVEVYLAEFNAFIATLGAGWGQIFFTVLVSYSENGFDITQDTILGCTIDEIDASQGQGPSALTRKLTFAPLKILYNGLDGEPNPLAAPAGV